MLVSANGTGDEDRPTDASGATPAPAAVRPKDDADEPECIDESTLRRDDPPPLLVAPKGSQPAAAPMVAAVAEAGLTHFCGVCWSRSAAMVGAQGSRAIETGAAGDPARLDGAGAAGDALAGVGPGSGRKARKLSLCRTLSTTAAGGG